MRRPTKILLFVLIAVFLFSFVGFTAGAAPQPGDQRVNVLIGFEGKPDVQLVKRFGGEVYMELNLIPVAAARMTSRAAEALAKNPHVRYIEPDGKVYAIEQTVPWGINRVFGFGDENYSFPTWDNSTGNGIGVAILDTGIDKNHEDLHVSGGINFTVNLNGDNNYSDGYGHGTHVAGTVAALNNSVGVVGVAPDVSLYAVKVLNDSGSGSWSSVAAGIQWAVNNNIKVINMSLGATSSSETLKNACDAAYGQGLLLVAAAGNSGNVPGKGDNVSYPAKYQSVIAVAASDYSNKRASFSSTGPDVELIAPGVSILSTIPGNKYASYSGTSMASPHAAGAAALAWAANPELSNIQVREILQTTAENLGLSFNHQGHGLVRADLAVAAALENLPAETGSISGVVTDNNGNKIQGANVTVEGNTLSATTDENGYYLLGNVPVGVYCLTASAEGYNSDTAEVTVNKDTNSEQNFTLEKIQITEESMYVNRISFAEKRYGKFVDLMVTVEVVSSSDSQPVSGAGVSMILNHEKGNWNFAGDTNSNGSVTFTLKKAYTGYYTATVTVITHSVYMWDDSTGETTAGHTI